jgi:hypothetical protein
MKTTVETDDQIEAMRLVKSLDMALYILAINQLLYKYADDEATEKLREDINSLDKLYGININELIE